MYPITSIYRCNPTRNDLQKYLFDFTLSNNVLHVLMYYSLHMLLLNICNAYHLVDRNS